MANTSFACQLLRPFLSFHRFGTGSRFYVILFREPVSELWILGVRPQNFCRRASNSSEVIGEWQTQAPLVVLPGRFGVYRFNLLGLCLAMDFISSTLRARMGRLAGHRAPREELINQSDHFGGPDWVQSRRWWPDFMPGNEWAPVF